MPVIATRYSGQTDFLTDENSYLVDIDGFKRSNDSLSWISYFYEDAEFPILGPDVIMEFRKKMRKAYEDREDAQEKAGKLYNTIVKDYDWKVCTNKMYKELKNMFNDMI